MRRLRRGLLAILPLAVLPLTPAAAPATGSATGLPPIRHVWLAVLENQGEKAAFVTNSNSYLPALRDAGAFIPGYYGTAHESLPNYIALMGGQAPNPQTQGDCQTYTDVSPGNETLNQTGQVTGNGCVYPTSRPALVNQLDSLGLTWKGYMEDMGNIPSRDAPVTCVKPATPPIRDPTQSAQAAPADHSTPSDQYAARHDPFMYFHTIIDNPTYCAAHVVQMQAPDVGLAHDLAGLGTTPSFSFLTPNLCDDGHDGGSSSSGCAAPDITGQSTGGLTSIDHWLGYWVPRIMASAAYQHDGLLLIIFDESDTPTPSASNPNGTPDSTSCCQEQNGISTANAGIFGPGGGQVGAVALSPFIKPGTVSGNSYNHYSLLRTLEDLFGTTGGENSIPSDSAHLGYASATTADGGGPGELGDDVFTNPGYVYHKGVSAPVVRPKVPVVATQAYLNPQPAAPPVGPQGPPQALPSRPPAAQEVAVDLPSPEIRLGTQADLMHSPSRTSPWAVIAVLLLVPLLVIGLTLAGTRLFKLR